MTKWRKAWRDLALKKGRMALVVLAIAIGVAAAGSVLGSYSIIDREVDRNYDSTNPASAILSVSTVRPGLVDEIESRPEVAAAAARREVGVRLDAGRDEWIDLRLVAIEDYSAIAVRTFFPEEGSWDPGPGEVLIERSSLLEADIEVGQTISAFLPAGDPVALQVTGLAHDPGRTPAWMMGQVVGYVNPETLGFFGLEPGLNEVAVVFADSGDRATSHELADELAADLESSGVVVEQIEIPERIEHPIENVMGTMLLILQVFGMLALIAGGAVMAIVVSAQLRHQSREIGLMKATGAGVGEIASIYLGTMVLLGIAGLVVGLPLGVLLGRAFTSFVFMLLNFEIASFSVDGWVVPVQVLVALAVPMLAAGIPILRSSHRPARDVVNDHGINTAAGVRQTFRRLNPSTVLGLRNAVRARSRTVLTALALSIGGAAFMVALNSGLAWDRAVATEFESRGYDAAIQLAAPYPVGAVEEALTGTQGVAEAEFWTRLEVTARLSDGGSGTLYSVMVPPLPTKMVDYPLVEGRWLEPGDINAVVVIAGFDDPVPSVGESIVIDVGSAETEWAVVGLVRQLGDEIASFAYLSNSPAGMPADLTNAILVAGEERVADAVEQDLAAFGIEVAGSTTAESGRRALEDHLLVVVFLLLLMAALVGTVGGLGLVETMSINVAERRRELGVMRALGASRSQIMRIVAAEGAVVAATSWLVAIVLSLPASVAIESATGRVFFGISLPPTFSLFGIGLWFGIVAAAATIASALVARRSADLPLQQALAYE